MLVIVYNLVVLACLLTSTLLAKMLWDYFLVYVYAHYVVNSSQAKLRESFGYIPKSWAFITGATDGIGRAYAFELARLGFNIIIHGRSEEKLAATLKEISNNDQILKCRSRLGLSTEGTDWIRVVKLDLSTEIDGATVENKLIPVLKDTDLRVLVNNAGVSFDKPTLFTDLGLQSGTDGFKICNDLVNVNVISLLNITRAWLKHLPLMDKSIQVKSVERPKAIIINVSSFAAKGCAPFMSVYAASKAFVSHFGLCLGAEYQSQGLLVQTVCPYFVVTKLSKLKRASLFRPNPEDYVKSALKMVGVQNTTFGYLPHALVGFLNDVASFFLPQVVAQYTYDTMEFRAQRNSPKTD